MYCHKIWYLSEIEIIACDENDTYLYAEFDVKIAEREAVRFKNYDKDGHVKAMVKLPYALPPILNLEALGDLFVYLDQFEILGG